MECLPISSTSKTPCSQTSTRSYSMNLGMWAARRIGSGSTSKFASPSLEARFSLRQRGILSMAVPQGRSLPSVTTPSKLRLFRNNATGGLRICTQSSDPADQARPIIDSKECTSNRAKCRPFVTDCSADGSQHEFVPKYAFDDEDPPEVYFRSQETSTKQSAFKFLPLSSGNTRALPNSARGI